MLIGMAGDVTADEVVETDPDTFRPLIDKMGGKTMDEYRREIGAAKKRIKEEVSYSQVGTDTELKSSYDTYLPGHEFFPIFIGTLNDNPNLVGNSANNSTSNAGYFSQNGWTVHPVVDLGN